MQCFFGESNDHEEVPGIYSSCLMNGSVFPRWLGAGRAGAEFTGRCGDLGHALSDSKLSCKFISLTH